MASISPDSFVIAYTSCISGNTVYGIVAKHVNKTLNNSNAWGDEKFIVNDLK